MALEDKKTGKNTIKNENVDNKSSDGDLMDSLVEKYKSGDESQRFQIIRLLTENKDNKSRRILRGLCRDEKDPKLRYYCRKALSFLEGRKDNQSVGIEDIIGLDKELLYKQAQDPDPWIRLGAIRDISRYFGDNQQVQHFAQMLKTEGHPFVRSALVKAIGRHGDPTNIQLISEFLGDKDSRVQANAIEALEMIGGSDIYPLLIPLLQDLDNRVRANALKALGGSDCVDIMVHIDAMLESSDTATRDSAAYALGELNIQGSVEALKQALEDKSYNVRRTAYESLKKLASRENSRAIEVLKANPEIDGDIGDILDMLESL